MNFYNDTFLFSSVASIHRKIALSLPPYTGINNTLNNLIINRCKGRHLVNGTLFIFTRDVGHHTSGWWKNPEYERCWHLSLSFHDPISYRARDKDESLTEKWIDAFFNEDKKYIWAEPPYSDQGKPLDVWHYRVFCNEAWEPIVPKGEVYSKRFTEIGWKSFSELNDERAKALSKLEPLPGEQ